MNPLTVSRYVDAPPERVWEVLTAFVGMLDLEGVSATAAVLVSAASLAIGWPLTWLYSRDVPLRNPRG